VQQVQNRACQQPQHDSRGVYERWPRTVQASPSFGKCGVGRLKPESMPREHHSCASCKADI
jgi:hypothetical protein